MFRALLALAVVTAACGDNPNSSSEEKAIDVALSHLLEEIAVTDALIAHLTQRSQQLQQLRAVVASGNATSHKALATMLDGSKLMGTVNSTPHAVDSYNASFLTANAQKDKSQRDSLASYRFQQYLVPKRTLSPESARPEQASPSAALQHALVAAFYIKIGAHSASAGSAGRKTGSGAKRGGSGSGGVGQGASHRSPTKLAVRVHADGTVKFDTDYAAAGLCAGDAIQKCSKAQINVLSNGASTDSSSMVRAQSCTVVGASPGYLPDPAILLSDSCGRVHVMDLVIKHAGVMISGRRRMAPASPKPATAREKADSIVKGGRNYDPDSIHSGTEVALHARCSITLPLIHMTTMHSAEAGVSADGSAAIMLDGAPGMEAETRYTEQELASAMATHTTGATVDRGNSIIIGTARGGAALMYHRNCTPAGTLWKGGDVTYQLSQPEPITALTIQGTVLAFASSGLVRFASLSGKMDTYRYACELPAPAQTAADQHGGVSRVTSLTYDASHTSLLWAGTEDGSLLLYNSRSAGQDRDGLVCKLMARLPPPPPPPQSFIEMSQPILSTNNNSPSRSCLLAYHPSALSVASVRGYVIAASGAGIAVYNASQPWKGAVELAFMRPLVLADKGAQGGGGAAAAPACIVQAPPSSPDADKMAPSLLLALPLALAAVFHPDKAGSSSSSSGGRRNSGGPAALHDPSLMIHEAALPPTQQQQQEGVSGSSSDVSEGATTVLYDVLLPSRRDSSGSAFPWEGDSALASLLSLFRGPLIILVIGGIVWYNINEARRGRRRRLARFENEGSGRGRGNGSRSRYWPSMNDDDGDDDDYADRGGAEEDEASSSSLARGVGLLMQGASFFMLRGPLGMAARFALARYKRSQQAEREEARDEHRRTLQAMGLGSDDADGGGRRDVEYERAIARMTAQPRMNRQLQALEGRARDLQRAQPDYGDPSSLRLRGGGGNASADSQFDRVRHFGSHTSDDIAEVPGGGHVPSPYQHYDAAEDDEDVSDDDDGLGGVGEDGGPATAMGASENDIAEAQDGIGAWVDHDDGGGDDGDDYDGGGNGGSVGGDAAEQEDDDVDVALADGRTRLQHRFAQRLEHNVSGGEGLLATAEQWARISAVPARQRQRQETRNERQPGEEETDDSARDSVSSSEFRFSRIGR